MSERSDSSDAIDEKKRMSITKPGKHPRQPSAAIPHLMDEAKVPPEEDEKEKEITKK